MRTLFIAIGVLSVFFMVSCSGDQPGGFVPEVSVYLTKTEQVPIYQDFVGQIYGYQDIAIRARVEGFLEQILFQEGSQVEKGKLLYLVESQPFEADVAAKLSRLAEAKTMLAKAQSDLNRIRPLAAQKAVSESDLDGAVAQYEAAQASVEAAEANLRASRIQLSYTRIYSPIDGIIGKTKAKVGDFVGRGPNTVILNVVSRLDTIHVEFFITENQYLEMARYLRKLRTQSGRLPEQRELDLILADGSFYEHKGKVDFIDREVDPTTGAMLVQASFPNPDRLIRPGQFAKIRAQMEVLEDGILIPQRCVMELQGQYRVYVLSDENVVESRSVEARSKIGNFWLIAGGLEAGERVIYEGIQKVREGVTVNPKTVDVDRVNQGIN
jgi:membrane fusion protein (multidrug efflux system)